MIDLPKSSFGEHKFVHEMMPFHTTRYDFQPLVKMGKKTVVENIDEYIKQLFGLKTRPDAMKMGIRVGRVALKPDVCHSISTSTISSKPSTSNRR